MGYTGMMFFASIVLAPIVLLVAAALFALLQWTRFAPSGLPALLDYALTVCACYALLYLYQTVQLLIVEPAYFQKKYIGEVVAGPIALTFFEQSGFQDPASEWRYRLAPSQSAELRKRCKGPQGTVCILYDEQDQRWFANVSIQGNELRMIDGLW